MFPLTQFLKIAAGGAILTLSAANHLAHADEMVQNLGPVGPNASILATVGSKNVITYYAPASGTCAIRVVVWDAKDTDAASAARIRVSLNPGQRSDGEITGQWIISGTGYSTRTMSCFSVTKGEPLLMKLRRF
jgi:hypothetical protein